jgi:raffinose/stachyose/melibiose transport system permease protein
MKSDQLILNNPQSSPADLAKSKKKKMNAKMMAYYLMVIPAALLFFAFHTFPAIQGIYYSFTNWNGINLDYDFVGFKNYINLFKDTAVRDSYLFTFKFAIFAGVLVNIISLAVAIGLNAKIKGRNFFRAVYFLPNILSVLIVGFIFNFVFTSIIPNLGEKYQIEFLTENILGNANLAWIGILIVFIWQSCAFWQQFWKITFPVIAPFFTINMVLAMKNALMVFDQIVAMTGGGPGTVTTSISYLIYTGGLAGGEFAFQSANGVIYFIVIVAISVFQLKVLQKREMDM